MGRISELKNVCIERQKIMKSVLFLSLSISITTGRKIFSENDPAFDGCYQIIQVKSSMHNSFNGLYNLSLKNFRSGRPLYKHLDKEVFMFYREDSNTWDIHRNPYSKNSYAYAGDMIGCPPKVGWKTIKNSNWVDNKSLRVIEYTCGTKLKVTSATSHVYLGTYNVVVDELKNNRRYFVNPESGIYLYYWPARKTWHFHEDPQTSSTRAFSRSTDVCPPLTNWKDWTGYKWEVDDSLSV